MSKGLRRLIYLGIIVILIVGICFGIFKLINGKKVNNEDLNPNEQVQNNDNKEKDTTQDIVDDIEVEEDVKGVVLSVDGKHYEVTSEIEGVSTSDFFSTTYTKSQDGVITMLAIEVSAVGEKVDNIISGDYDSLEIIEACGMQFKLAQEDEESLTLVQKISDKAYIKVVATALEIEEVEAQFNKDVRQALNFANEEQVVKIQEK